MNLTIRLSALVLAIFGFAAAGNCTTQFVDSNKSDFATFGYFALAGLEVPVSPHVALAVEECYTVAHANLGSDFKDNSHLDLSGQQLIAAVTLHF